jgi:hypothetical protein
LGKEPATSASPPVLAKGTASGDKNSTFTLSAMEIPQFAQFALKVCEIFLGVKGLIKGMKRGDDAFLVKISHDGSPHYLNLLQKRIQLKWIAITN